MLQNKPRGLSAFEAHFEGIYQARWPALYAALKAEPTRAALINVFAHLGADEQSSLTSAETHVAPPWRSESGLTSHYPMDLASILAAHALPIKAGDRILDMCAAPGGKALELIMRSDASNSFVLNERSATRRGRLKKVIEDYIPERLRAQIKVTGFDATKWCLYEKDAYDAILLDAPCSSERHLLEKPALMAEWSTHRSKVLALQEFAMLASAAAAVKPLGHVLYATCSISPAENDEVIAKLLRKRDHMELVSLNFTIGEATECGWMFLPDTSSAGPLYLSLLRRALGSTDETRTFASP